MSLALASFLGGAGAGYIQGKQQALLNQQRQQEMDIQAKNAAFQQSQQQRQLDEQQALSQAAQPAQVDEGAGGMTKPAYADNRDIGLPGEPGADNGGLQPGAMVNGQSVPDAASALSAAKSYDDPAARLSRQSDVMERFQPGAGITLQNAALKNKQEQLTLTTAQREQALQAQREGLLPAAIAAQTGDPQKIQQAFNSQGDWKLNDPPTVTPAVITRPGFGDINGYKIEGTLTGPNGETRPFSTTSHDLNMQAMSYKDQLDALQKATTAQGLNAYHTGMVQAKQTTAEAATKNAETNSKLAGDAAMTPDAIMSAAARYNIDGTLPPMGFGKSAAAQRSAVLNAASQMAQSNGLSPDDQRIAQLAGGAGKAALTKLMTQQTTVGAFEKTFNANADLVQEYSAKVDRTGVPIVNKWIQAGKRSVVGDPDLSAYDQAIKSTVNEYSKIISGSTGNTATAEGEIKKVEGLLNAAQNPQQVDAVLSLMKRETANRMNGFAQQRTELLGSMRSKAGAPAAAPGAGASPASPPGSFPKVSSIADAMKLAPGTVFIDPNGVQRTR